MKNVLAAVDFSAVSERVLEHAAALARAESARLWLVHVAAPDPEFVGLAVGPQHVRDHRAAELRKEHRELQQRAERLRASGIEATALLVQGQTVEVLLAEADRLAADVIVIGSHGRGALHRALVGSACEGVLRRTTRPTLVVPDRRPV